MSGLVIFGLLTLIRWRRWSVLSRQWRGKKRDSRWPSKTGVGGFSSLRMWIERDVLDLALAR